MPGLLEVLVSGEKSEEKPESDRTEAVEALLKDFDNQELSPRQRAKALKALLDLD